MATTTPATPEGAEVIKPYPPEANQPQPSNVAGMNSWFKLMATVPPQPSLL